MLSKSATLENRLLQDITLGKYPAGALIPSRNRLAERYGCSRTTVERAISSLTRAGFLESRKGSGTYVISPMPNRKISKVIFVSCVTSEKSHIESQLMFSADSLKLSTHWVNLSAGMPKLEDLTLPGAAVVWIIPGEEALTYMDYLEEKRIPQILLNRDYRNYNAIFTDPVSSIREGLAWLMIEAGREIALVAQQPGTERPYLYPRMVSFYELCVEFGAHLRREYLFSQEFVDIPAEIADVCERIFRRRDEYPRGIFVMNSELAMPLVTCAQGYGLKAGVDYFLLIFDEVPELQGYPGIGMMRQAYHLFVPEVMRWLRDGHALDFENRFCSPLKTSFQLP